MQDVVGDRDLAHVVEQEAELGLGIGGQRGGDAARQLQAVGGDPLRVLARVGVAGLDRVGERADRGHVGLTQLVRASALGLEDVAQVGGIALELALALAPLGSFALQLLAKLAYLDASDPTVSGRSYLGLYQRLSHALPQLTQ
ncbi:MAG: hypothetical protein WKF40_01150 [Thermoleophilaceae bacterium]